MVLLRRFVTETLVPTTYPKCTPSEMMGFLVLLKDHKGEDDLARLADDLDLELDEILPASDFAEALQLVSVTDGRVSLTDIGRRLLAASIRERKSQLRELLKKTTLFRTVLRALENAPENQLREEDLYRLISITTPPGDEALMNIINWGRFADLFRYNPELRAIVPGPTRKSSRPGSAPPRPPAGGLAGDAPTSTHAGAGPPESDVASHSQALPSVGAASPLPTPKLVRRLRPNS